MELGDIAPLLALLEATGFFSEAEILVARELADAAQAQGTASGYHFLLAHDAAGLAGFACYGPVPASEGSHDLYWIAVHPRLQGRGLGGMILSAAEAEIAASGGERVFIETSSRSQYGPTQGFYARQGYQLEATLRDFYSRGDSKLIFRKDL